MRHLTVSPGLAIATVLSLFVVGGATGYWLGISDRANHLKDIQKEAPHVATGTRGTVPSIALDNKNSQIGVAPDVSHQERSRGNPAFAKLLEELTELAMTDAKKAFEETQKITPESYRPLLRAALAKTLLKTDFSKVGEILVLVDNHLDRQSVLFEVLPVAIKRDRDQTLSAIRQQLTGMTLNSALRIAVQTQIKQGDVDAAIETQLSMPFSDDRDQAIANIVSQIAAKGLDPALEWLKQLQPEREQVRTRKRIQEFFAEKRDYSALERLLAITSEARGREMLIRVLASQFKSGDELGARALMNSLSAQEQDFVRMQHIVNHPTATFEKKMQMAAGLSSLQARSDTFREIVREEVSNDPIVAGAMAISLPEDLRLFGVSEVVGHWARIDSKAVSVWVQEVPKGKIRESAISRLAQSLKYIDKPAAREVAAWLDDQPKREALIRNIEQ